MAELHYEETSGDNPTPHLVEDRSVDEGMRDGQREGTPAHLGSGRNVVSEREPPNMFAIPV